MLSFDLSHQAAAFSAINQFIELSLNFGISDQQFVSYLEHLIPAFKAFDQDGVQYSASIQAFIEIVHWIDYKRGECGLGDYLIQLSLEQIKEVRRTLRKYRFAILAEIRQFRDQENDNQKLFLQQLKTIIYDHNQLLFVRVDLGYLKDSMPTINIKDFYAHISSLIKLMKDKNNCFKHLLGYGLALEQGITKGYHGHLLLIYNGSKHDQDWDLGDKVTKKWESITHYLGYGRHSNTKEIKDGYKRQGILGIGMIKREHPSQVHNALKAAQYLVEPEKYGQMLLVKPLGRRSFFKGSYKPHGRQYQIKFVPPPIDPLHIITESRNDIAWLDELWIFDQ
ncbi:MULTISPECIES: inovirus-type Gp2 protein [Acinetobacter]|uniref:inovirus-type Gp2 protein n=1 Tax=Acinetobacter TaxID=469 RepID=UPI001CF0B635|nr:MULTISPECIES: inovirus-type Gp2 protein [Acinetobacter]MCG6037441.1 inovirus Gp2 family protein [Acinetobacter baumannii]